MKPGIDILRFAHRFFHFESAAWIRALNQREPNEAFARSLFKNAILPRRTLKKGEARSYEHALEIHERLLLEEAGLGIRALSETSPEYPPAILQFVPPDRRPALLYLRGKAPPEERQLVGVVGTRSPSQSGKEAARCFASFLEAQKIGVVSGLARGIDTIAHEESLSAGTIAVLGADVGRVYPEENQILAERILACQGTLLSPFPLEQVPLPQNFPERNELIAALSAGIVVIEGAEKSGAAITGRQALSMGKCVVALAQDFRSKFGRGAIRLQQDGAVLVCSEEEAMEAIYRRFGGYSSSLFPNISPPKATFTFADFHAASGAEVPEAIAALEEGILQGRIERWGSKFRLSNNAKFSGKND